MKTLYAFLIVGLLSLPTGAWAIGTLTPAAGDASFMVSERAIDSNAAVMVNGNTVFTVSGGPILIVDLYSICITANGAVASTMQWQSAPTVGSAATFSGASGSLINATAGTTVRIQPTILTTAMTVVTDANGGVQVPIASTGGIIVNAGTIKLVIAVGSTTGTWKHYLRYKPLSPSSTVN